MKKRLTLSVLTWIAAQTISAQAGTVAPFANYLYLTASEQTAAIWSSDVTSTTSQGFVFSPKNTDFDWDHGFRAGLSYLPDNQFWETRLYWTNYKTQATDNHRTSTQIILPDFFSGFLSGNYFFGANLDWNLRMNSVDIEAGHRYQLTNVLSLRPSIGIKGTNINQTINANWDAILYMSTEQVDHQYYGIGPTLGIDSKWDIYKPFSFVGTLQSAFLWGTWNINDTYRRPSALFGIITPTTITTKLKHSQLGTLMLDYFVGMQWEHVSTPHLNIQLGYEMQYWANQLRIPTFQELPVHGDLTLQGATCGISLYL